MKGGQILGEYPDNLTDEGPLTLGRGRMIPSTPWDAVFKGIAVWLGVPNENMKDVLPNLHNFPDSFLFTVDDMFEDVLPQPPTAAPTPVPKTPAPTASPTKAPVSTAAPTKKTDAPTKATTKPTKAPTTPPTAAPTPIPKTPAPTASPTKAPVSTEASSCFDDESFAFKGNAAKNCAWVKKKTKLRCEKKNGTKFVFESCKKTCGTCSCKNENWMFKGIPSKNCDWVAKKFPARCDKSGAKEHCKGVCGLPCCKDDPDYRMGDNQLCSCDLIAIYAVERCPIMDLNYYKCPATCGKC